VIQGWLNKGTKADCKENIWTVKEGEYWRIRTNKEIKGTLKGSVLQKLIKSLQLRWYGHVERMKKTKHAKTNCNSYN
jgi:hypothetical protein